MSRTFHEQLNIVLAGLDYNDRTAFLAGVRFTEGAAAYGDSVFDKTDDELIREQLEEEADAIVYRAVRRGRYQVG